MVSNFVCSSTALNLNLTKLQPFSFYSHVVQITLALTAFSSISSHSSLSPHQKQTFQYKTLEHRTTQYNGSQEDLHRWLRQLGLGHCDAGGRERGKEPGLV